MFCKSNEKCGGLVNFRRWFSPKLLLQSFLKKWSESWGLDNENSTNVRTNALYVKKPAASATPILFFCIQA